MDTRKHGEAMPMAVMGQITKSDLYARVFFGRRLSSTNSTTALPWVNGASSLWAISGRYKINSEDSIPEA